MAKKAKAPDALPSKAWLMSFGDTMTTLLAFFIVLCSLAENQSGMNLYVGTGSFIAALESGGLNGGFDSDRSAQPIPMPSTSPLYMLEDETESPESSGLGPDDDPNEISAIDRENDVFVRALNEIAQQAELSDEASQAGVASFDFFTPLNREPPLLGEALKEVSLRVIPLLLKGTHRFEIVVWAPTPSPSARKRTSRQARLLVGELLSGAALAEDAHDKLIGVSRAWPYAELKRPVMTLVVERIHPVSP